MVSGRLDGSDLEDVTVALNAQADVIHIDLRDKRYSDFRVPFQRDEVEDALDNYAPDRLDADPLVAFGSTLFNALFAGERGRGLWQMLDQVTRDNRALRLRIKTNLERTQHLPWELLFDASRQDFVALSGRVALVRTRPDDYGLQKQLAPLERLRMLAFTADPSGELGVADDMRRLRSLATDHARRLQLEVLEQCTAGQLKKALGTGSFDVVFFLGRGEVADEVSAAGGLRQSLQLVPEGAGDDGLLKRNEFGQWLHRAGVRLAVMAGSDSDWIARSLAKHVQASIGFRAHVHARTRHDAFESLCKSILAGRPLDLAVTEARQAIDRGQPGAGEWCRLIFYLQADNGRFLLEPLRELPMPEPAPLLPEAPQEAPAPSRDLALLLKLRQLYESNLQALERTEGLVADDRWQSQATHLRTKLDELGQRIAQVHGRDAPGGTNGRR